jgi:CheY-like chemotaxis protein
VRILLVEDEIKVGNALSKGLQAEGCEITWAQTGEEGFFHASSHAFDLIVLDVMLPGRDGIEVLHTLRTQGSKTPVLLLTAKDVLPKPAGHQVHVFVATVRQTWRFVDGLRSAVSSSLGLSGNATNSSKTGRKQP